jgi:ribosomal protein L20
MRGANITFYHFLVTDNLTDEKNYYRTCQQICDKYGLCRGTIYNMINRKHKPRHFRHLTIERHYTPVD